ncbi:MAG: bepA 18 [Deltaproteobacteria bacterium]|nr:bepA 18 [Deltaproteobacteria bacterium]
MNSHRCITLNEYPFRECLEKDEYLAWLRTEYTHKSAEERRMAADFAYHSSIADRLFDNAMERAGQTRLREQHWPGGVVALAIDPLFSPALLTVGSIEYQLARKDEAMNLFLALTTLPADEMDLPTIIDKAGDFLLGEKDYHRARELYTAAIKAFPSVAVFHGGLSYTLSKLGLLEEAVASARRASDLEPENYQHLNDLGWTLCQAGYLEEARAILEKAVRLAPTDYDLARNNLKELQKAQERG